ncbi:MAG: cobyrinate a,c-diamide synthase [Blautia sp.]|nr:cobyrinate a,c-diamide synthase [Blautia sp.]MDY3999801.1 cobyrinate a,c-diamide synthase [Blautia sp.]
MNIPRILLAAGASGSGKTLITCGILQALVNRGKKVASFKCGPDYIDPMFHSRVIGTKSRNLDTFFTDRETTKYLLAENAADCDIAVIEGVMGYYDGVGGITDKASAYDLADTTDTPVIFIVNSRGMSISLAAYVKGFLEYRKNSHIRGVILNQMSPMLYPRMKKLLEEEFGVQVLGYVPKVEDCVIESRHLGLVLPDEIPELKNRLMKLAGVLEKTLDMDGILALAESAEPLEVKENTPDDTWHLPEKVRIGVADDEAFCFFYEDNFRLLRNMGAELVPFSPLHDRNLPDDLDGMLLYGGYPELNGSLLEQNETMRQAVSEAIRDGMPCMAECGGFMYLHEKMEGMDGKYYHMTGVIPGKVYRTPKLTRFGYITLERNHSGEKTDGQEESENLPGQENPCADFFDSCDPGKIQAHEFHYFDSENCGTAFHASKPASTRGWDCMHSEKRLLAGFPHLYYYGNPCIPETFLEKCLEYKRERENIRN